MKKNFLMSIVVAALVVFGVKTYYDKKTTNNDQVSVEKENKGSNETGTNEISNEMLVPGYALGEIPPIKDGSGEYTNKETGVTLQVDAQGSGQYLDDKNKVSFQIAADGTGVYKDENDDVTITIAENSSTYTKGNITVKNNDDGSGTYNDKYKDLLIENDGKGKAIITLKGKSTEVEAKPLEKPEKFPKLKMVPPVPSIEANSLLITLDSGILFDVDKYDVRPEAERARASLATVLKEADVKAFEIDGHTDSDASDEYNQALSEKRANAVKDFLASQGLTSEITIIGYGESRPVASNDTPEGKQKNRRVEILIPTI